MSHETVSNVPGGDERAGEPRVDAVTLEAAARSVLPKLDGVNIAPDAIPNLLGLFSQLTAGCTGTSCGCGARQSGEGEERSEPGEPSA